MEVTPLFICILLPLVLFRSDIIHVVAKDDPIVTVFVIVGVLRLGDAVLTISHEPVPLERVSTGVVVVFVIVISAFEEVTDVTVPLPPPVAGA